MKGIIEVGEDMARDVKIYNALEDFFGILRPLKKENGFVLFEVEHESIDKENERYSVVFEMKEHGPKVSRVMTTEEAKVRMDQANEGEGVFKEIDKEEAVKAEMKALLDKGYFHEINMHPDHIKVHIHIHREVQFLFFRTITTECKTTKKFYRRFLFWKLMPNDKTYQRAKRWAERICDLLNKFEDEKKRKQ